MTQPTTCSAVAQRSITGIPLLGMMLIMAIMLQLTACTTLSEKKVARATVFYPPLPNPPRIQYLTSFSGPNDITPARSSWLDMIVGKDNDEGEAIRKPYGVAVHGGRIYVVDTRGGGYAIFDLVNRKFEFIQGSGGGKLLKPINICVDTEGNKYVTDTGREQVVVFDKDDRYARAYGNSGEYKPTDVAVSGDRVFVTDLKHQQVHVLDKASGKILYSIGKAGSNDGEFVFPTNLTISKDQYLYVTDTGNFRIQKFTLKGELVRSYGAIGTSFGQFARPKGVALDNEGRLYVVDAAFQNVQILSSEGRLLMYFGSAGDDPESMNLPTQVVIDYDNLAYFQAFADPQFKLEYVILVANQFGASKVNAYGYGRMEGIDYSIMPSDAKEPH